MERKAVYAIIAVTGAVLLCLCIWGKAIFELSDNDTVGLFVAPLIGGVIGGLITFLGIELSNSYQRDMRKKQLKEDRKPFLIVDTIEVIQQWKLDEEMKRFPWGGNPSPWNCIEIWLPSERGETKRIYIKALVRNVGGGLAQNITMSMLDMQSNSSEIILEAGAIEHLEVNQSSTQKDFYVVAEYRSPSDDKEYPIFFSYCDMFGGRYAQLIKLSISVFDDADFSATWMSIPPIAEINMKKKRKLFSVPKS